MSLQDAESVTPLKFPAPKAAAWLQGLYSGSHNFRIGPLPKACPSAFPKLTKTKRHSGRTNSQKLAGSQGGYSGSNAACIRRRRCEFVFRSPHKHHLCCVFIGNQPSPLFGSLDKATTELGQGHNGVTSIILTPLLRLFP